MMGPPPPSSPCPTCRSYCPNFNWEWREGAFANYPPFPSKLPPPFPRDTVYGMLIFISGDAVTILGILLLYRSKITLLLLVWGVFFSLVNMSGMYSWNGRLKLHQGSFCRSVCPDLVLWLLICRNVRCLFADSMARGYVCTCSYADNRWVGKYSDLPRSKSALG